MKLIVKRVFKKSGSVDFLVLLSRFSIKISGVRGCLKIQGSLPISTRIFMYTVCSNSFLFFHYFKFACAIFQSDLFSGGQRQKRDRTEKSRIAFVIMFLLFAVCPSFAETPPLPSSIGAAVFKDPDALIANETAKLETLIQATQQSLEEQKKLLLLIKEYKKIQDLFFKNPQDNDLLLRMAKTAYRTLEAIKANYLVQAFDSDFIDELTVLSQAALKRGIPKP